jgi:hypothetical protein
MIVAVMMVLALLRVAVQRCASSAATGLLRGNCNVRIETDYHFFCSAILIVKLVSMCHLPLHKEPINPNFGTFLPYLSLSCSKLTRIARYVAKSDNGIEWKEVGTLMQEQVRAFFGYFVAHRSQNLLQPTYGY